jgi:SHS2 domain-containing protein
MYRWVEHTSEVELALEASSERGVFADALSALAELLSGPADPEARAGEGRTATAGEQRTVSVSAGDRATLLAGWLEELVFLAESEGFVATRMVDLELRPESLEALVGGRLGDPPPLVKAVTLHRLLFEPRGDGYVARVVLDV